MADITGTNKLIAALPAELGAHLQAIAQEVELPLKLSLEKPGELISHVYFVDTGLVSVVAAVGRHQAEVGLIGYEGVTGLAFILGAGSSPNHTMVQGAGTALRIPIRALTTAMADNPLLGIRLRRFVHVFMVQASQTALSNSNGKIEVRLARWLLMAHDRLQGDQVTLTHEFMAIMLSVRRQGVTVALHELEGRGLIRSRRSAVMILDRAGLIEFANGSYGIPEAEVMSH
ncbi:MAG: Crp/Fnr family transcriptional regulator [Reyranella sp.]|nr:Crp/Fnr family transcriptional regulator [Reyranella sp.]